MSYIINKWNGDEWSTIQDGTVDQTLDIKLIGKNYAGYGEIQNENFLHMLENFARSTEPSKAITGQLWYDTQNKKIKVFTGEFTTSGAKIWKSNNGAEYGAEPTNPTAGDLWFDTDKAQLKVKTDTVWLSIGPQNAGTGLTQMVSRDVLGMDGVTHAIIAATINDEVTYIISADEFRLDYNDADSNIIGFQTEDTNLVKKGITLANTNAITGISGQASAHYYWGTAGNALRLAGYPASDYVRSSSSVFTAQVRFYDPGFTVGNGNDLAIYVNNDVDPYIESTTGPQIIFKVKDGSSTKIPAIINNTGIIPGSNNSLVLGAASRKWANVYATTFTGIATQSDTLLVGTEYRLASTTSGLNTVAARDGNGYLYATKFKGTADEADSLSTPRTINGVNFDGTGNIIITDDTKVALAGSTMTGYLTLAGAPTSDLHASTKKYVDDKFGQGGILSLSHGGTSASTAADARTNLVVPSKTGDGASGTWNIDITGNADTATTSTNLAAGATGSLPYQSATGTTSMLAIGTSQQVLVSNGATPIWQNLSETATGVAAKVTVTDRKTETATHYLTFIDGSDIDLNNPNPNFIYSGNKSVYIDTVSLKYNSNANILSADNFEGSLRGSIYSPDASQYILDRGTGDGSNASFIGNSATATQLKNSRTISLTGIIVGSASFDGTANASINTTISSSFEIALGSNTTGNYVASLAAGTNITLKENTNAYTAGEGSIVTIAVDSSTQNDGGKVVVRDQNGDFEAGTITAELFDGVASSAKYADLAEKYLPDAEYEPGTVVSVGGTAEITASSWGDRALGVISTQPAYMMNKELEGGVYVALKGRVPCKVVGAVRKGQRLVASNNGYAVAAVPHANDVFGIALESSDDTGVKTIEVVVL